MHEYVPPVLEAVFEAEWLRREGVFSRPRERKDHENDLEMTRLRVNCIRIDDEKRAGGEGRGEDKSSIVETR